MNESPNPVQRTGASRFVQTKMRRYRRLAPVADLMRWRATHTTSQTLTISLSLAFLVGVTARSAPKEFDGLTPAQVFERLEGAIAAEPAARLRRFIGQRVEFEGDDGLGSTPANVRVRVSGINCQVYLSQAEIKEFPPTRQYNTFSPSGPLYPDPIYFNQTNLL
jgi:hypothetical protein